MLKITKAINLKDFSGMKVSGGGTANLYIVENYEDFEELLKLVTNEELEKMILVGEGSNTVFVNVHEHLNLLKININTLSLSLALSVGEGTSALAPLPLGEGLGERVIKVGAGVNWDFFVQKYIELGGVGMESLSAIPGTVGAAPVQNIGAYGKEVVEFIESVEVYDREESEFKVLKNEECEFKYRDSVFKQNKNRYIVLYVNFKIIKGDQDNVKIPEYKDIQNYLQQKNIITKASDLWSTAPFPVGGSDNLSDGWGPDLEKKCSVEEVREAVVEVRRLKLPDPSIIPNCGSFFKNPIINREELESLKVKFPEVPVFPVDGMMSGVEVKSELVKIPVAYIIEKIGLKGYNNNFQNGNFGIHKNHALIVISNGNGEVKEFTEFVKLVKQKVFEESGLVIEEEVNLI